MGFRKLYKEDGVSYIFNTEAFNRLIAEKKISSRKEDDSQTQDEIEFDIASKIHKPYESVRNWTKGSNGPGDIGLVKDIAEYFDVDFMTLLIPTYMSRNWYSRINSYGFDDNY